MEVDVRFFLVAALLVCGLVSLMGCNMISKEPMFEIEVAKEGDGVETAVTTNTAIFNITSDTGIGSASIQRAGGEWPETILFRVYLSGLEDFKFVYGDTTVTAAVSSSGEQMVLEAVEQAGKQQPVTKDSGFFMPVRVETDYFEIEVPADFFAGEYDAFSISWIDFYR
jgi:hypothetical protein